LLASWYVEADAPKNKTSKNIEKILESLLTSGKTSGIWLYASRPFITMPLGVSSKLSEKQEKQAIIFS